MVSEGINGEQLAYLLRKVTLATRRKFTEEEGSLWLSILGKYSYDACYEAFNVYLERHSNEFLDPGFIARIITERRKQRLTANIDSQTPPNNLTGKEYLQWLDEQKKRVSEPPSAYDPTAPQLEGKKTLSIES